jgi:hypothetical protein
MTVFENNPPHDDEPQPQNRKDQFWNLMTVLVLVATVVMLGAFILIYRDPTSSINPFPPATMPVALILPTSTPTIQSLPPTWTAEPTGTALPSATPIPFSPTPTYIGGELAITPTAAPEEKSAYAFSLEGEPSAVSASIFSVNRSQCNWMGVGGRVVDLQKRPVTGILIQLGGTVKGKVFNITSLTGTATNYGESGYEFTLSDTQPFTSKGMLWIRLMDQQRIPLSAEVHFDTQEDCSKNLIIINFKQVR